MTDNCIHSNKFRYSLPHLYENYYFCIASYWLLATGYWRISININHLPGKFGHKANSQWLMANCQRNIFSISLNYLHQTF